MTKKTCKHLCYFVLAGLFFIIDRYLKLIAPTSSKVGNNYIAWEYFENTGIAFGIPIAPTLVVIATPILLLLLFYYTHKYPSPLHAIGWSLLFFGAISNFIDRLLFGFVIDYIRIFTGVINLADLMILGGMFFLFFTSKNKI